MTTNYEDEESFRIEYDLFSLSFRIKKSFYDSIKDRHHKNIAIEQARAIAHTLAYYLIIICVCVSCVSYLLYTHLHKKIVAPSLNFTCRCFNTELCLFDTFVYLAYVQNHAYNSHTHTVNGGELSISPFMSLETRFHTHTIRC